MQESLGRIFGLSLLTFDTRGRELAATGVPELCRLIGADPEGALRCAASCAALRDLALAENRTLYSRCHAGLQCFALPILVAGRAVAVVSGGRTIERAADVEAVGALARALALPDDAVRRAIGALTLDNPRLLVRAAELAGRAAEGLFAVERDLASGRSRVALLTSLLAIGADFAREQAPHELHALILDAAAILFDVGRACLLVHDERTGRFLLRTAFGAPTGLFPAAGLPAESRLLEPVLRDRAPAVILDRGRIAEEGFPPGTGSLAIFPLLAGERTLGLVCVLDTPLDEEETPLLAAFCQSAALALSNALLREQADTDPLTGLANRRCLESRLREEASRARRHGSSFTLTMIEVGNVEAGNGCGVRSAGDALIAAVARVVKSTARDSDLVARYGRNELALVSPETRRKGTLLLVERLRRAIEDHPFEVPGVPTAGGLTLSAGVAEFPRDAVDSAALVRAADTALDRAKSGGLTRILRPGHGARAHPA